jgi:hypothetical protein
MTSPKRGLHPADEGFEKFDNLFLPDTALVQPEQEVGVAQDGDDGDTVPVEVKLDDGRLVLQGPNAHWGRALADGRLVYEDNQPDDEALAARLQREGADSFTASWQALLSRIGEKRAKLAGTGA